ncbi:MAG: 50S ribosomal protein L35 [Eubacteriaceae bacterium]|jgi:large subunit ribosomal protein L35|nr:50S ribosomal protein L35 [Eubacteriaceae bacterium]MDD4508578.1 50S ribosomal protein L35 [Eubacteriaceae bacterium]
MPKMKSHRGSAKRFKIKKSGVIKRAKAFKSHKLNHKTRKRKRNLRKASYMLPSNAKVVRKMLLK